MTMSELDTIQRAEHQLGQPITRESLVHDLTSLGLSAGQTVLVHSSLSALGWVCGGPVAVIQALEEVLTPNGTLVMPTHSADLSDPAKWQHPPVPDFWWVSIRRNMPPFDPDLTPTRDMGLIAETFRKQTGALRSWHPTFSFAAWGQQAEKIVEGHSLEYGLGEDSPLARLYELDGYVLLLGTGHDHNTSLHLAESRADFASKKYITDGAPLRVQTAAGKVERQWVVYNDLAYNEADFEKLGAAFEQTGAVHVGPVGCAQGRLMPQRALVDFSVAWLEKNRA
jgi:aminoglycoside 3-N-acetyltransferase